MPKTNKPGYEVHITGVETENNFTPLTLAQAKLCANVVLGINPQFSVMVSEADDKAVDGVYPGASLKSRPMEVERF